jgi:hypothetical protein
LKLVGVDALVAGHLPQRFGERFALHALELETGLGIQHPVVDQIAVLDGLLVAVVVGRETVAAVEQLEGVVVDVVGGGGGETELDGVEMVENGLVPLVDGAVGP